MRKLLRRALLGLIAAAVLGAAAVAAVRLLHVDEALPGTELAGASVAGASATEIRRRLRDIAAADAPIAISTGEQVLRRRPSAMGYAVDVEATVRAVMRQGRDGFLGGSLATLAGLAGGRAVTIAARIDEARLGEATREIAQEIERPSFPGALEIDPASGTVGVKAPEAGRKVDRRALEASLRKALLQRAPAVTIDVARRAVATRVEVEDVARRASEYLQQPLLLDGPGGIARVGRRRIARVLALEPVAAGQNVRLGVDPAELRALVDEVAARRDRAPVDARVQAPPRPVVIDEKADVAWRPRPAPVSVTPGRPGRAVDRERLARDIARAIRDGAHAVAVPARRIAPEVGLAEARAIDSIIGTFTTYYPSGEPRVRNIQRMAATVDGHVVAPGEQFSLNGAVGPRTRAKGYVPAPFIADGRIIPSVGGGVSQFSTTLYNAAYFAGVQLDAHQPHSLYIDRYPAGREATLNYPDIDQRWTNDTATPVLIRAVADATSVSVTLYGDNGGRRVRAVTGPRTPAAGGDFAITVTRVVRHPDGRVERQPYTTRYERPAQ